MDNNAYHYQLLPITQLHVDRNHPRKAVDTPSEASRLHRSIRAHGLLQPIIVTRAAGGRYTIIDGQRRYHAAKALKIATVPVLISPKLSPAEVELRRFELQNNYLPATPRERVHSLERIKQLRRLTRNDHVAELVGVSTSLIGNSRHLQNEAIGLAQTMDAYGLSASYRTEFIRLTPKLRRVGAFDVPEIIDTLLTRIHDHVIRNAKDLRTLGRIFARAHANEAALTRFLADPDMTVAELAQLSSQATTVRRPHRLG